jgi:hypothetical protein
MGGGERRIEAGITFFMQVLNLNPSSGSHDDTYRQTDGRDKSNTCFSQLGEHV